MHSVDRHWRAMMWVGGLALSAVVLGLFGLVFVAHASLPSDWWAFAIFSLLFFPAAMLPFLSRHREQLRTRAIAGEATAMPLARLQPDRSLIHEVGDKPLELRTKLGTITATAQGLLWQRPKRQDVYLAWGEIRLFEIGDVGPGNPGLRGYCVYGGDGIFIEWPGRHAPAKPLSDPSGEEFLQLQDTLLALIAKQTGLPVRTLVPRLAASNDFVYPHMELLRKGFGWLKVLFFVLAAMTALGSGTLVLLLPLTRAPAVNLYVATVSLVYGAYLLRPLARAFKLAVRSAEPPPQITLPRVSADVRLGTSIALKPRVETQKAIGGFALGVCLIVAALLPPWYTRHNGSVSFSENHLLLTLAGSLRDVLLFGFLAGMLHVLTPVRAFFIRRIVVVADEQGLHEGEGKAHDFIPWSDVDVLVASVSIQGLAASFAVVGNGTVIDWPADARWVRPPEGASPGDAGAQFAAIVAQRAGVEPTTRWA